MAPQVALERRILERSVTSRCNRSFFRIRGLWREPGAEDKSRRGRCRPLARNENEGILEEEKKSGDPADKHPGGNDTAVRMPNDHRSEAFANPKTVTTS